MRTENGTCVICTNPHVLAAARTDAKLLTPENLAEIFSLYAGEIVFKGVVTSIDEFEKIKKAIRQAEHMAFNVGKTRVRTK